MGSGRMSVYRSGSLAGRAVPQASYDTRRWWYALLLLSIASILVFLYLFEAARVARLNGDMEDLESELSQLQQANSALVVRIADAVQLPQLKQRAKALGFAPPQQVDYIEVLLDQPAFPAEAIAAPSDVILSELSPYSVWQRVWRQFSDWMGGGSGQVSPPAR
jgi:hypothetical protein